MASLIQISRLIVVFSFLFCHRMRSLQEPTAASKIQDQGDLLSRILKQLLTNNVRLTLISLVNNRVMKLEDNFKILSKKIDNIEENNVEFQNMTKQVDDIEIIVRLLNDRVDKIGRDLNIITANLKNPGKEWKNFDGVYYFFSNDAASWDDAKTKCEAMSSSSLVTIGSKQINDFLIRNGNNDAYWTGGNDKKQEDRWVWEGKGNSLTYTDWRSSEPNNSGGKEDCLVMYTQPDSRKNHWNDLKCGAYNRYICQTNTTSTQ